MIDFFPYLLRVIMAWMLLVDPESYFYNRYGPRTDYRCQTKHKQTRKGIEKGKDAKHKFTSTFQNNYSWLFSCGFRGALLNLILIDLIGTPGLLPDQRKLWRDMCSRMAENKSLTSGFCSSCLIADRLLIHTCHYTLPLCISFLSWLLHWWLCRHVTTKSSLSASLFTLWKHLYLHLSREFALK